MEDWEEQLKAMFDAMERGDEPDLSPPPWWQGKYVTKEDMEQFLEELRTERGPFVRKLDDR